MQRTVLYQHGSDRTSALIQLCLDYRTGSQSVRVGLKFEDVCGQANHLKQCVYILTGLCGNRNADNVAAPLLAHEVVLGELFLDFIGICALLIHLVDGNDDGNSGSLCVVDSLNGLRHNTVVRRHYQYSDIRDARTARSHRCERFVSRSIQECDIAVVDVHSVSTDVLCDAACLGGSNAGMSDIVQQGRLTVVNVTHYNYDRITRLQALRIVGSILEQTLLNGHNDFLFYLGAEFLSNQGSGIEVDGLVKVSHNAQVEQLLDYLGSCYLQSGSQLGYNDLVRDLNLELLLSCALKFKALELLSLCLALAVERLALVLGLLLDLLFALEAVVGHSSCGSDGLVALVVLIKLNVAAAGVYHLRYLLAALNSLALLLLGGRSVDLDLGGVDSRPLDALLGAVSQRIHLLPAYVAVIAVERTVAISAVIELGAVAGSSVVELRSVAVSVIVELRTFTVSAGTCIVVTVERSVAVPVVIELRTIAVCTGTCIVVAVERTVAVPVVIELRTIAGSAGVVAALRSVVLSGSCGLCFLLRLCLDFCLKFGLGFSLCFRLDICLCLSLRLCLDFRLILCLYLGLRLRINFCLSFSLRLCLYLRLDLCLCFSLRLCGSFLLLRGGLPLCSRLLLLSLGLFGLLACGSLEIFVKALYLVLLGVVLQHVAYLLVAEGGLCFLGTLESAVQQLNYLTAVNTHVSRNILYTILFVWQCNFPPY